MKDGASSICLIAYISQNLNKEYIVASYVGEALLGLVPSTVAFLQGTGEDKGCRNVTETVTAINNLSEITYLNKTTLETIPSEPFFSVSTFFLIIFAILLLSNVAFIVLNKSKIVKEKESQINTIQNTHDCEKELLDNKPQADATDSSEKNSNIEKFFLYSLSFIITFFYFGILPGLQSYSTLPYGIFFYILF